MSKTNAIKVHKGVYYFSTDQDAREWAISNHWPTDRIVGYVLGYAVQACVSGRYAGPDSRPYVQGETWQMAVE